MTIWVFTICYNAADVMPFFLRHYLSFADKIHVWDDHSDDGTKEMLVGNPKVIVYPWDYESGIQEDNFLEVAYDNYPCARGIADWVMWVDTDEFIYHADLLEVLKLAEEKGYEVIQPDGFNMMHEGMPKDDGRQIWEICKIGVRAPVYSKPIIFQPHIRIRWNRGKHALDGCKCKVWETSGVKLLHYRYLGYEYTKARNAKNFDRCMGDKGNGWTCHPDWHGEHSPDWALQMMGEATEVL